MKVKDWTKIFPKYSGRWVALGKNQEEVIGWGKSLTTALKQAKKQGFNNPSIFKVPSQSLPYVGQA